MDEIRARVLRGIALNRTPGFHFAGNFLGVELAEVGGNTRVAMEPGTHSIDANGEAHLATVFMVADIALAAAIRAQLSPSTRLATVSMHLQMNGEALRGTIEGRGTFAGIDPTLAAKIGTSRAVIHAGGREVGFGHGAFMALEPPPGMTMSPVQPTRRHEVDLPGEDSLDASERGILRRAEQSMIPNGQGAFISRFFGILPRQTERGASCRMENGPHVGNRVGHAQGGILMGLAAATAVAALGDDWRLASIAASFVSPGDGEALEATASIVHRGRWTAVARTEVIAEDARRVLEVTTTHARRAE
jgi:acyl-coenzyme A thioesterase PaaI-like protein